MTTPVYRTGISLKEVNEILGKDLSTDNLKGILHKAGFEYKVVEPRQAMLAALKSVVGRPYKRGASVLKDAPDAFDCSSLIAWTAVQAGYAIPRITIDQYVFSERIDAEDLLSGDLVFSNTGEIIHTEGSYFSQVLGHEVKEQPIRTESVEYMPGTKVPQGVDHVGMYIDENKVIHSSIKTGGVVEVSLDESNSFKNIVGYGRIVSDPERFVVSIPDDKKDFRKKEMLIQGLANFITD
jgi:hypothetical protein